MDTQPLSGTIERNGAPYSGAATDLGTAHVLPFNPSNIVQVSIVTPFHNESECLPRLIDEIGRAMAGHQFELVAVDDGSTDGSSELIDEMAATRPWLRVAHLPRNRGQTEALAQGIQQARGEIVVTMDADGQNDPSDIESILRRMAETGADVIAGRRVNRKESLSRRLVSSAANRCVRSATGVALHDTGCTLKAFRATQLRNLNLLRDDHRFLPAFLANSGAVIEEVPVSDRPRFGGASHYGFKRVPAVMADICGLWFASKFRGRPLRAAGWCATTLFSLWTVVATLLLVNHHSMTALAAWSLGVSMSLLSLMAGALLEQYLRSQPTGHHAIDGYSSVPPS